MASWTCVEWLQRVIVYVFNLVWDYIWATTHAKNEQVQVREGHAPSSKSTSSVLAPSPPDNVSAENTNTKSVVTIIAELVRAPATPIQGTSRAGSITESTTSLDNIEALPLLAGDTLSPAVAAIAALVEQAATLTHGTSGAVSGAASTSLEVIVTPPPPACDTLSPAVAAIAALIEAAAASTDDKSTAVSRTAPTSSLEVPLLACVALPQPAAATLAAPAAVVGPATPAVLAADVAAAVQAAGPAVKNTEPVPVAASALPAAATAVRPGTVANLATDTSSSSLGDGTLAFGVATAQNKRTYQEDRAVAAMLPSTDPQLGQGERRAVAAVFDGHGGAAAAEHLQQHMVSTLQEKLQQHRQADAALTAAVADLECQLLAGQCNSGSTLTAVLLDGDTLHIVNVGDSRAVLCRSGQAVRLTTDHTPTSEQEKARILAANPTADITADGYCYGLGVSRDLGNYELKASGNSKGLSAVPEVGTEQLKQADDFVVIGSDGLFDSLRDSDAITTVRRALVAHPGDCTAAAQAAVDRAIALGSSDNVTAVVLLLHSRPIQLPKSNSRLFRNRSASSSSSGSDGGSNGSISISGGGGNGAAADSSTVSC